jgi:hypothetical protein
MDAQCHPFLASMYIHHMAYFPPGKDVVVPILALSHYMVRQSTDLSSLPCVA